MTGPGLSRRGVIGSAVAGMALASGSGGSALAQPKARYTRYNVTSPKGQEMLQSYLRAVRRLMALPPDDPRNWFRTSFIHALDCPHGNWWFFVWHRGYLGWFEQVLREFSDNKDFAIPYWDWTTLPQIPPGMFEDVLNPSNPPYNPFIQSYDTYYKHINRALTAYWKSLTPSQLAQLKIRGIPTLSSLWTQVKGNPQIGAMFATTPYARYLTASGTPGPALDASTQKMVSLDTVMAGLGPIEFAKFNSNQTASHNAQPSGSTRFGILEGQPHNNVHNNIGGVGYVSDWQNFGYMADNLSPTDPVFFLHHSNMDRLWDVWTRKQQKCGLQALPTGASLAQFEREPFEFYINAQGKPVTGSRAGKYIDMSVFGYDYEPGSGEQILSQPCPAPTVVASGQFKGQVKAGVASVAVPASVLQQHADGKLGRPLVVQVTLPHPTSASAPRAFDVFVNAPANATGLTVDSPSYVGTVSFFGAMHGMHGDATFVLPLPRTIAGATGPLNVRTIPRAAGRASPQGLTAAAPSPSVLKAATVSAW